jgi:DNA modification methylase
MTITIRQGDCRDVLRTLPEESVHMCVTSPPYFGLRDYGTGQWEGGDPACSHIEVQPQGRTGRETPGGRGGSFPVSERAFKSECRKCGAARIDRQIGLEATPEAFVAEMVAVFRAVRRALRSDGTCWLNLGDSYASGRRGGGADNSKQQTNIGALLGPKLAPDGFKAKDLLGIPWRVAFALQADGWYLRQDIIWSKPNPMPESVRDRCTKAHEYIFLLAKSERYYYDADAIAEQSIIGIGAIRNIMPRNKGVASARRDGDRFDVVNDGTRNRRSVWEVATQPYAEAHFATFPPALIEPCILAGCPKRGTVLDPFGGAGTTGLVADRLGRNAILIELNPEYAAMAERRIRGDAPLFAEVANGG